MPKSIKERLADKINKDLKPAIAITEHDFVGVYGNYKNDLASWCTIGEGKNFCSWSSMTELVNKKELLVYICEETGEIA